MENVQPSSDRTNELPASLSPNDLDRTFCVNVSDCYVSLPYLCEVNCTGQQSECSRWTTGNEKRRCSYYLLVPGADFQSSIESNIENAKAKPVTQTVATTTTTVYDPCLGHQCVNEGTCVYDLSAGLNYTCQCIAGYEGQFCQRDERPCLPHKNKCKNNSTCNQFYNSRFYNCTCPDGFKGN